MPAVPGLNGVLDLYRIFLGKNGTNGTNASPRFPRRVSSWPETWRSVLVMTVWAVDLLDYCRWQSTG